MYVYDMHDFHLSTLCCLPLVSGCQPSYPAQQTYQCRNPLYHAFTIYVLVCLCFGYVEKHLSQLTSVLPRDYCAFHTWFINKMRVVRYYSI